MYWKNGAFFSLEVTEMMLDIPLLRLTFTFRPVFLIFCDIYYEGKKKPKSNGQNFCSDFNSHLPFTGSCFHSLLIRVSWGLRTTEGGGKKETHCPMKPN